MCKTMRFFRREKILSKLMSWCPKNNSDTTLTEHCIAVADDQVNMKNNCGTYLREFALRIK